MKFFFKDFVMSSGRFNLPLQQTKVLFFPELMAVLGSLERFLSSCIFFFSTNFAYFSTPLL